MTFPEKSNAPVTRVERLLSRLRALLPRRQGVGAVIFMEGHIHMREHITRTAALATLTLAAGGLVAMGCTLVANAQEGMPTARRLAAMKADYKRPPARPVENRALVDLGRSLFWDPRISASGKTSCASCHYPISAGA